MDLTLRIRHIAMVMNQVIPLMTHKINLVKWLRGSMICIISRIQAILKNREVIKKHPRNNGKSVIGPRRTEKVLLSISRNMVEIMKKYRKKYPQKRCHNAKTFSWTIWKNWNFINILTKMILIGKEGAPATVKILVQISQLMKLLKWYKNQ